jgi:hypothetical protein
MDMYEMYEIRELKKEIDGLEQANNVLRGRIIMVERENKRLRAALQHIADISPVTDQSTGYDDDSCQATALNALQFSQ